MKRMCSRTTSLGERLTHGTSERSDFQSASIRQSNVGNHVMPASITTTRSSGYFSKTPWDTRLTTCDMAHWIRSTCHSTIW